MLRLSNIRININKIINYQSEAEVLQKEISSKLHLSKKEVTNYKIFKKSIQLTLEYQMKKGY